MRIPSIPTGYVFPLLIVSAVGAWRFPRVADVAVGLRLQHWMSDAVSLVNGLVPLGITLLPFLVAAAFWRVLPRGMRMGVLGILALLAAPLAYRTAGYAESLARRIAHDRRVAAELAPMREAMRVPPQVAARRAIAAGNHELLAVSGFVVTVPGLSNACAVDRHGWMLVRGTGDFFESRGHRRFQAEAWEYARRYNDEVVARLRLDRAELERGVAYCSGDPANAEARRRYWPDGGPVE